MSNETSDTNPYNTLVFAKPGSGMSYSFNREDSGHTLVVAPSGRGLSFMLDELESEAITAGAKVVIVDKGPSSS
jgi:type IV secretory pathway VirB4 component